MEQLYDTKPYHATILDDVASHWGWDIEQIVALDDMSVVMAWHDDPVPGINADQLIAAIKAYRREAD